MHLVRTLCFCNTAIACWLGLVASSAQGGIVYDSLDSLYQQSFDSLPSTGQLLTWQNDSNLAGWSGFSTINSNPLTIISSSNGSSPIGGLESYGNSSDRSLGTLVATLSTTGLYMAVAFENGTSIELDRFTVTYDGEQWRRAQSIAAQSLAFSYGFGDSFASVNLWTSVSALNFLSPITGFTTAVGIDGNAPANRRANITSTITGINWAVGDTLWLRWFDAADPGNNHGMGIDNFRFTASGVAAVPEPSSIALLGLASLSGLAWRKRQARHREQV